MVTGKAIERDHAGTCWLRMKIQSAREFLEHFEAN
jgi:hypothetical protein